MFLLKSDNYTKNTLYSICGFGILTIANFVFQAIAGRVLGQEYYGIFTAFFSLLVGLAWANSSLQLASAKYLTINNIKSTEEAVKALSLDFWLAGLICFCIILALYPFFRIVYGLKNFGETVSGAGVAALWLILAGYRGIYQGQMDFLRLGINTGLENIIRVVAGYFFIIAGWKISGALGASIAGSAAAVFLLLGPRGLSIFEKRELKINTGLLGTYLNTCLVLVPFGLIYALDLTFIKYLRGADSGYIAVCTQFGKSLVTLSLFFSNVVYAYSLKNRKGHFWAGIFLTILAFSLASLFTVFFGKWIVLFIYNDTYLPAAGLLPVYIIASLPLGIMLNILNYAIARNIGYINIAIWVILILLAFIFYFTLKAFSLYIFLPFMGCSVLIADLLLFVLVFFKK